MPLFIATAAEPARDPLQAHAWLPLPAEVGTPKTATLLARNRALCCHSLQLALAAHMARELTGQFVFVFNLVDLASPTMAADWGRPLERRSAPAAPTRPGCSFTATAPRSRALPPRCCFANALRLPSRSGCHHSAPPVVRTPPALCLSPQPWPMPHPLLPCCRKSRKKGGVAGARL